MFTRNGSATLIDIWNKLQTHGLGKTICGDSILSIFDIIESLQFQAQNLGPFVNFLNNKNVQRSVSLSPTSENETNATVDSVLGFIRNNFKYSSDAWRDYEKFGRRKAIKINKKTNPYVQYSGSVFRSNTNNVNANTRQSSPANTIVLLQSFNNLTKFNDSQCPARRIVTDLDPATQVLVNSSSKSCFCKTMYVIISILSEDTQVLFRQVKPILLGKLLYSPDTPEYRNLVKRANSTFANIDHIAQLIYRSAHVLDEILIQTNMTSMNQWSMNITSTFNQMFNMTLPALNVTSVVEQLQLTTQMLYFLSNTMECFELNKFIGYPSEEAAVNAGKDLIKQEVFWAAVIFKNPEQVVNNVSSLPEIVSYKIRMNSSLTHDTTYTQDKIYRYGPSNCLGCNAYFIYGFIYIQDMIEKAIIEMKTQQEQIFGLVGQMMPYPCHIIDKFVTAISRSMPLFMVLAWIYTVSMMVKDIVYEKERRLKEFMRVMGLSNGIHWLSWFITSFVVMFFIIIILCIVLKYGKITTFSDITCLIVFFTCFTIATITQCFLISIFFNRANLAAVVAGILYFLLYLPYTVLVNYEEVIMPWQKFLASLSSTVAFSYGCELLAAFEQQNIGITWNTFYKIPFTGKEGFSLNTVCLILRFDSIIFMFLTCYIEGVWPGEFGIPRRWYFPVQPSYWCGENDMRKTDSETIEIRNNERLSFMARFFEKFWFNSKAKLVREEEAKDEAKRAAGDMSSNRFKFLDESIEKTDITEPVGIRIERLHKIYSRGSNHALKGLTVNFYQNEISAFLGHNGAGN